MSAIKPRSYVVRIHADGKMIHGLKQFDCARVQEYKDAEDIKAAQLDGNPDAWGEILPSFRLPDLFRHCGKGLGAVTGKCPDCGKVLAYEDVGEPSLHDVLESLGMDTRPGRFGRKDIIKGDEVLFTGHAHEVWEWLQETSQYESKT